jgi:hypothetical protein
MFDCFYSEPVTTRVPGVPDHDPGGDQQARYWRTNHNADQLPRNNRSYSSHGSHTQVIANSCRVRTSAHLIGEFFEFFYVLYSALLHLPPLRFHCVGGNWDRTQNCGDFGHWLSKALTTRLNLIYPRLDLILHTAHSPGSTIKSLFEITFPTRRKFLLSLPLSLDHNPRNLLPKNTWSAP